MAAEWTDLLDPAPEEIRARAPRGLGETAFPLLTVPPRRAEEPPPTLRHGDCVVGLLRVAVTGPADDRLHHREPGVAATCDALLTVRRTPERGEPYDPSPVRAAVLDADAGGMILSRLVDDLAEHYLGLADDLDAEIDELEDRVEEQGAGRTRQRVSDLSEQLLHVRRTLAPIRDAVRRAVVDDESAEVFPQEVAVALDAACDKFGRALDRLELSHDLLASVLDRARATAAHDRNDALKRLTVIASLLLLPTLAVGLHGPSLHDAPGLHRGFGYGSLWGIVVVTTLAQLWWFGRRRWI